MNDEHKTRKRVNKKARVPFGGHRAKLQLSDMDAERLSGYQLRWFNDQDGRLERAQAAGYEFVDPEDVPSLGTMGLHQENTDLNSKVSKVVSRGTDRIIRAYLMKIDKDLYDEDQQAKEAVNAKVDQALRPVQDGGRTFEGAYTPL